MAAAAGGGTSAGIGPRLRAAREKKGLTLLQTAEKLHVDAKIVEALEAEDFAALGAPVYARGHLRHYAELVDESVTELQGLYSDATKAQPALPDLTRIARGEPMDDSRRLAGPVMVAVIAVAVIGSVWWVLNLSTEKVHQPTRSAAASSPVAPLPPAPTTDDTNTTGQEDAGSKPAVASGSATGLHSNATTAGANAGGARPAAGTPVRPGAPGSSTPGGARASTAAGASPANAAASGSRPGATAASPATAGANTPATVPNPNSPKTKDGVLTLKFSADSWAEVYDASGQRLFYDVGAASSAHTVKGPAPLRVVLGNASGVAVEYNGRPALIPASNQPDGSARFVINAHGRATPASAPASNGD